MVEHHAKSPKQPTSASRQEKLPGRLGVDDKGNISWQWADDIELQADDTLGVVARMQALVDPALSLEDEELSANSPIQGNPKGLKKGYDPYDSGALGKQAWTKKKDLRELSKWIEMRKKLGQDTSKD
jgi:hypothetical protein